MSLYPEENLRRAHLLSLKFNFQFKFHKDRLCKSLCKERQSEKVLQGKRHFISSAKRNILEDVTDTSMKSIFQKGRGM